jgi:hypothetical protein
MVDLTAGSYWQENYGEQDPGFLFPNRLDSLKVKNEIDKITDLDQYTMTPSIVFNPAIPVNGDTVTVTTAIHNLSLSPTDAPVEVSFYLGDPDEGGELISDVNGNVIFTTGDIIEDQNYSLISFQWIAEFERFDRMYAVIDPMDKLGEGNESNNVGWSPVQRYWACGEEQGTSVQPFQSVNSFEERFDLYPNPAGDLVHLNYSGPYFSSARVTVYDVAGKAWRVEELSYRGGNSRYTIDTRELEPGMYIISVVTDHYRQQTRLVIR